MDNTNKNQLYSPCILKSPHFPPCNYTAFLAVVSRHRYFVQHGNWFAVFGIEMQELKLHEFWGNRIFESVGDMLIANLVSIPAGDSPSNEYVIEKVLDWPSFDLQPVKVVSTFYLCMAYSCSNIE